MLQGPGENNAYQICPTGKDYSPLDSRVRGLSKQDVKPWVDINPGGTQPYNAKCRSGPQKCDGNTTCYRKGVSPSMWSHLRALASEAKVCSDLMAKQPASRWIPCRSGAYGNPGSGLRLSQGTAATPQVALLLRMGGHQGCIAGAGWVSAYNRHRGTQAASTVSEWFLVLTSRRGKTVWCVLKKLKMGLPCSSAILLPGVYPKEMRSRSQRDTCSPMFIQSSQIDDRTDKCAMSTQWNIIQP
jgi:hypothetical protein